jgi:hypothetical protein
MATSCGAERQVARAGPANVGQQSKFVHRLKLVGAVGCSLLAGVASFVGTTRILVLLTDPQTIVVPVAHPLAHSTPTLKRSGSEDRVSLSEATSHVTQVQIERQGA